MYGKEAVNQFQRWYHDRLRRQLESLKWLSSHGYIGGDFNQIAALICTLRSCSFTGKQPAVRLHRLMKKTLFYLRSNKEPLASYGR